MSVVLPLLLLVVFIAVVASLYTEGMWGNAIMLVNVVTATLLATSYFEPLADWLERSSDTVKTFTYVLDFLSLWGLFAITLMVLRMATDSLCRVKVRFLNLANQIGGVVFACLVALVMVCFTTFSLHTAPLAKNFMYGAFTADADKGVVFGWAPDRWWIHFARSLSSYAYCRSTVNKFDRYNQFAKNYETRRATIEKHVESTGAIRVR